MCFGFHVRERYYYDFEKYSMTIGSKYWIEGILYKTTNIDSGFRSADLWPLYFPAIQSQLKLFEDGSIADS